MKITKPITICDICEQDLAKKKCSICNCDLCEDCITEIDDVEDKKSPLQVANFVKPLILCEKCAKVLGSEYKKIEKEFVKELKLKEKFTEKLKVAVMNKRAVDSLGSEKGEEDD
jgi:hypothetical protein